MFKPLEIISVIKKKLTDKKMILISSWRTKKERFKNQNKRSRAMNRYIIFSKVIFNIKKIQNIIKFWVIC